ncbi:MAG: lamin tail domain-containing protein [Gemmatimonadota bacterium]|nr:lamin tail domain-containing protein [Gemmatimonadota bacterium]
MNGITTGRSIRIQGSGTRLVAGFGALLLAVVTTCVRAEGRVVISEVMFDPSGSEFYDEFIEIQNTGSEPVDLAGWLAGDGDEADELVFEDETVLLPGAFGLILDSGYFAHSTRYDPLPPSALILTVADATIGSSGLSNSTPERIVLVSSAGDTVGAMVYTTGNKPGYSEEKVDPAGGDGPENWMDSRWEGGTPGRVNSVSPKDFDLALERVSESPFPVPAGVARDFVLQVINRGRRPASAFFVDVRGIAAWHRDFPDLEPAGHLRIETPIGIVPPGQHEYVARVVFEADEDTSNNQVTWTVLGGVGPRAVIVNEVMYAPVEGEPEWVELHNRSGQALDVIAWRIEDAKSPGGPFGSKPLRLQSDAYLVVAEDVDRFYSRFPDRTLQVVAPGRWARLNDSGDAVVLRDATGAVVDSMVYDAAAFTGRSLERISGSGPSGDPLNWLASTHEDGATPGRENSVALQTGIEDVRLVAEPNPFYDRVEIRYLLPSPRADVNLWVYDRSGHPVKRLLNAAAGGSRRRVTWDGSGEDGVPLKPGIYILFLETSLKGRIFRTKAPVVLARGL